MIKRLFISTGEVSGDLQGALLVTALRKEADRQGIDLEILALGGDRMATAGAKILENTTGIGAMGIIEALPYAWSTLQLQKRTKKYLVDYPPDAVILIDYMGPNIALGSHLRKQRDGAGADRQPPIYYYIAPQEWVWSLGDGNTTKLIGFVDEILAIFPGEASHYAAAGAKVQFVGHPLIDGVEDLPDRASARATMGISDDEQTVVLMPASRTQELKYLMPVMFEAAQQLQEKLPQVRFWIPLAMDRYRGAIETAIADYGLRATIWEGGSQVAIAAADLAITKSGTVSLEIALQNIPQVVIYRVSAITATIAQKILKFSIPFMSPANLVLMEPVVPELLQDEASADRIYAESYRLLTDEPARAKTLDGYRRIREALGAPGACQRAAVRILASMS
jgi:lipid-A-disaccharide synthase